ncbi:cation efflux protein zinc transporter [Ophiostoma piceae UAMH 11346]|uniref:Zinc transporter n=1 Tax=Ophiostoma piceae (strain UAMH 11346) TaxID=1262450 RepID=S3CJF2_OPHP1|nr:cation efflux protein zinc transporter [Ophiostoma piceae UAMH 11346]
MASPFAFPGTSISPPKSHLSGIVQNGGSHASHGHSHGHSHSHTPNHNLNHNHNHSHSNVSTHSNHSHSGSHGHAHDQSHNHNHNPSQTYSPSPLAYGRPMSNVGGSARLHRRTSHSSGITVTKYPIVHAILKEKDSRRIFYFMTLNFAFMTVQAFYGYVTDSLGLLSDSVHMFFDCVALAVGLFAAVASKWPPSERFPYGFGKIETLSGFANGIFLILISVEIMVEAFERLVGGRETQRLMELFVVSTLGLLVNLVGIAAVIASTVLTHFWSWSGWDPLASFLIALLIMLSAIPLVKSSARRLLLTIPDSVEYSLRETLAGVPSLRGVASYAAPKFWLDDRAGTEDRLLGVMHILAARGADAEDVRMRVHSYMFDKGIDVVVQVERDGDGGSGCWCGPSTGSMGGGVGGSVSMANKRSSMVMAGGHGPKPSIL